MKKELFVPFDGKGNLLDYVYSDITNDREGCLSKKRSSYPRQGTFVHDVHAEL